MGQWLDDVKEPGIPGEKIFVFKNGNLPAFYKFYNKNKNICRIDSFRRIEVVKNWITELLCGYFRKQLEKKGVSLYIAAREWAHNHPLFPQENISSEQMRHRYIYNRFRIRENQDSYIPFLKKIYGEKYSPDYMDNVMYYPDMLDLEPGKMRHKDYSSPYVNVVNGERYTVGNPSESRHSIYLLGSCFFSGYTVEDCETMASFLQKRVNTVYDDWRVVTMGAMGARIYHIYKKLYEIKFRKGDIVVIDYGVQMPLGEKYKKYDITTALKDSDMKDQLYFEAIIHCNHIGYKKLADKLWIIIRDKLAEADAFSSDSFYLSQPIYEATGEEQRYHRQAMEYINMVKENTPESWNKGVRGAIVMNCNPFTLGHQYLIRQSAAKVDHLYIFVVEEDKSFFPFQDRIKLVKAGTQNIKNVVVVPSGKLIISTATFPGYFSKDSPGSARVDTSLDVNIFGRYIAAPLGITKRFVGEEPIDMVTRSYNESMKEILPRYGIEVDEIKRKEKEGGVISASRVRKALQTNDFDLIRKLVPDTTYKYLWENRVKFIFSATKTDGRE